jgi:hypothetical protein
MPRQDDLQVRAQRDAIKKAEYIFLLVMSVGISTDELENETRFDALAALLLAPRRVPQRH